MSIDRHKVFGQTPQAAERLAPGFFSAEEERLHLARYSWASQWVRRKLALDVACGTGYGSKILLGTGARRVVAVDLNEPALAFAAQTYPGPTYVQADALKLPLKMGSFDMVVSLETIEHLADPVRFLQGVRALLRENGLLVLSTPNASRTGGSNPYHLHEMTLSELLEYLERTSFHVIGLWGQHWSPRQRNWPWQKKWVSWVAYQIEQRHWVWRAPASFGFEPLYWCILARATQEV